MSGKTEINPDLDKEAWEIVESGKTMRQAAKQAGVPYDTFRKRVYRHRQRVDCDAYAPDGFKVKGTSTLIDSKGNKVAQWIKTTEDAERRAELQKLFIEGLKDSIPKEHPAPIPVGQFNENILAWITLTDLHLGMFAHATESGDDWSTEKAEQMLYKWLEYVLGQIRGAQTVVFLQNGDFMHFDGMAAVTPQNRHILDADVRYGKLVRIAAKFMKYAITRLLACHPTVHVICAEGNHDQASSANLRAFLPMIFEDEPRLTIDQSDSPYYGYKWGDNSLFAHHGDRRGPGNISVTLAAMFRELFGSTKRSYVHLGHFHHASMKDDGMMTTTVHPTLAAKDSYAGRHGYIAQRRQLTHLYHKQYGETGYIGITPEMLL